MSARAFSGAMPRSWRDSDVLLSLMAFGFCGLATFAVLRGFDGKPLLLPVAFGVALAVGLFCLVSTRYTLTLGALMLFLGLADGYLKLRFEGLAVTALRDALLFSICAGALMRLALSGERIRWPPLTALVAAWVVVVLVQLANPANGTLTHSLLSLRSHIEWVPLFFFGYVIMRDKRRLFGFLTILLVITMINGAVSLYQYEAGPAAIAAWGPGYQKVIFGGPAIAGRTFIDASGTQRLRPPGLGSDTGYAGVLAVIAGPAAFVFLMLGRRRLLQLIGALFAAGVLVAVLTAQVRIAIIGLGVGIIALVAAQRRLAQARPGCGRAGSRGGCRDSGRRCGVRARRGRHLRSLCDLPDQRRCVEHEGVQARDPCAPAPVDRQAPAGRGVRLGGSCREHRGCARCCADGQRGKSVELPDRRRRRTRGDSADRAPTRCRPRLSTRDPALGGPRTAPAPVSSARAVDRDRRAVVRCTCHGRATTRHILLVRIRRARVLVLRAA